MIILAMNLKDDRTSSIDNLCVCAIEGQRELVCQRCSENAACTVSRNQKSCSDRGGSRSGSGTTNSSFSN